MSRLIKSTTLIFYIKVTKNITLICRFSDKFLLHKNQTSFGKQQKSQPSVYITDFTKTFLSKTHDFL